MKEKPLIIVTIKIFKLKSSIIAEIPNNHNNISVLLLRISLKDVVVTLKVFIIVLDSLFSSCQSQVNIDNFALTCAGHVTPTPRIFM